MKNTPGRKHPVKNERIIYNGMIDDLLHGILLQFKHKTLLFKAKIENYSEIAILSKKWETPFNLYSVYLYSGILPPVRTLTDYTLTEYAPYLLG